jgi:hypothetical protein
MRAVEMRKVEGADAAVEGAAQQSLELRLLHARVVRGPVMPMHPGAEAEPARVELGAAQAHRFRNSRRWMFMMPNLFGPTARVRDSFCPHAAGFVFGTQLSPCWRGASTAKTFASFISLV